jgi:lysophospholipid hydrolase
MVSEYGQGESVGELEVLTNSPRSATVHAIRDTELARMPKTLFNALSMRHPEITIQISRIIASRSKALQQTNQQMRYSRRGDTTQTNLNLKTVALIPTNENVAIMDFAERLRDALQCIHASAIVLDSATVTSVLGRHAFTRMGKLKLLSWLTEQEEKARLVLYVADSAPTSPWTQRCIRQARYCYISLLNV